MIKKIICLIIGHKWLYTEPMYSGEFDGKFCERCNKDIIYETN